MMLPQQQLGGSSVDIACVDVKKEDAKNRAKNSITYMMIHAHITFFQIADLLLICPKCFKRYTFVLHFSIYERNEKQEPAIV